MIKYWIKILVILWSKDLNENVLDTTYSQFTPPLNLLLGYNGVINNPRL